MLQLYLNVNISLRNSLFSELSGLYIYKLLYRKAYFDLKFITDFILSGNNALHKGLWVIKSSTPVLGHFLAKNVLHLLQNMHAYIEVV